MGNSCTKFAILFFNSKDYDATGRDAQYSTDSRMRFYMAVYDTEAQNTYSGPQTIGNLEGDQYTSVVDISARDAVHVTTPPYQYVPYGMYWLHSSQNDSTLYQGNYQKSVQIASSKLIDNCFYYVFVSDGSGIIRYKLTDNDLEWDDYFYDFQSSGSNSPNRTEMEMVELANGNYRLTIPTANESTYPSCSITLIDLDANFEVANEHLISLTDNSNNRAYPNGLEFDATGNFLYVTHKPNSDLPNKLDVYDVNAGNWVSSLPILNGIGNYEKSFIERYGDKMYVVNSQSIGVLNNTSSPSSGLTFTASAINLNLPQGDEYGNNLTNNDPTYPNGGVYTLWKYVLPDQIDDGDYTDFAARSCDCCRFWKDDNQNYTATGNATWTASNNPFGSSNGEVYIKDYLRIKAGANIAISNMTFYFAKDARVIVERSDGSTPAATLKLTNRTVFTADNSCGEEKIIACGEALDCKDFWRGVRVEGYESETGQPGTKQAYFEMSNGSMIEFAKTGIWVGHEYEDHYGGGIISIQDSYLKDNLTGIKFDPFTRLNGSIEQYNKSGIYRNTFSTTDDWFSSLAPNTFIDVKNSSGLNVKGNTFVNANTLLAFPYAQRGIGIRTSDSRIMASWACQGTPMGCPVPVQNPIRNVFRDLSYGIYGLNTGNNVRTLTCNYGLFENNYIGIFLSGFNQPKILDNTFEVQSGYHPSIGLFLGATTGYYVQNNDFSTYMDATTGQCYGIYVSNSGPVYNEIYRNHFETLMVGGFVDGQNADGDLNGNANGLQWICNTFDKPIRIADILLNGRMSDEQGHCYFPNPNPARNLFSHSSAIYPGHEGLMAYFGSLQNIDYNHNYNTTAYPRLIPAQYSGQSSSPQYFQMQSCMVAFNPETSCPVDLSGAPETEVIGPGMVAQGSGPMSYAYLSEQVADYAAQITALENQLGDNSSETEGTDETIAALAQLRQAYRKLWHSAVSQYQSDTTGTISTAQLQNLIATYQPESIERFASILLPEANTAWISESNLSPVAAFSGAALPALTDGSLPYEIPAWFESDFFATASNASALNALYIENEAIYEPYVATLSIPDTDWGGYQPGGVGSGANPSQLSVQPNPFIENVQFNLSNYTIEGDGNRIAFYDVAGKQLFTEQIDENQAQVTLAGDRFPEGIILYTLYVNDVPVENGKMIRVK